MRKPSPLSQEVKELEAEKLDSRNSEDPTILPPQAHFDEMCFSPHRLSQHYPVLSSAPFSPYKKK